MKTYEKHVEELGYEIADEIIKKEKDSKWETILEPIKIARSLSNIYDKGLKKTTEDLEREIQRSLFRLRQND